MCQVSPATADRWSRLRRRGLRHLEGTEDARAVS